MVQNVTARKWTQHGNGSVADSRACFAGWRFVVLGSSHAIVVVGSCRRGFAVGVDGVPPTSAGRELVPSVVSD